LGWSCSHRTVGLVWLGCGMHVRVVPAGYQIW
jgi:hypothetical protein